MVTFDFPISDPVYGVVLLLGWNVLRLDPTLIIKELPVIINFNPSEIEKSREVT